MNPASNTFLSYQPGPMPHLQSTNANQHDFFDINCSGHSSTEPYIFDPNTKMMNFIINISGLHMEGLPSSNNSHIYNALTPSLQHDVTFQMGTAVKITNFQSVFVDSLIIENIYGNGIHVKNRDYALRNDSCNINSNVVLNTWGLRYKKDNNDFDNSGDAILTEGIRNGVSYFNYIKNDLATTHQYGRLGLGTCCEHNKDCSAEFNYVSGYDRGIHIENGRGGFQVRYNRITGSETGIVMDGIRSYLKKYNPPLPSGQLYIECDAENASRIEYNYISNEEIPMQEDSLMKIYPPQLIFAHGMNWSNTDNASFFKNNYTYINIDNIPDHYKAPVLDGTNDPRPYHYSLFRDQSYHLFSSVKKQEVDCNVFKTTLSTNTSKNIHGGTHLQSGVYTDFIDTFPDPKHCNMSEFLLNDNGNNSVPMYCRGNSYTDCYKNWFNLWVSSSNHFYENTITGNTLLMPNPDLVYYTKANPNSGSSFSCPLLAVNNTLCGGKPLIVNYTDYDEFWQNTTLSNTTNLNNKTILVTGTLILNADLNLSNCRIFLTSHAKIVLNNGSTLTANSGCVFRAICEDMWDGIYADDPIEQITLENSTLKDMENGVVASNGAKLHIVQNNFIDNYISMQLVQAPIGYNSGNGSCLIHSNSFMGGGNPLLAPYNTQSKPESGIRIRRCSEVQIGLLGLANSENTFKVCFNGILIEPGSQNQPHDIKIYNNRFEQIQDDIQPGFAYYSTLIGNTYTTHRGAGIYAVPYSVAPLNITSLHRIHVNGNKNTLSFDHCDKAIVTSYFGANIQNIQTSNTPLGFMFGNADGQWIEAGNFNTQLGGGQHNILNDVMIGIQVLGNTSKTFINDNEINLSGDYYQNGPINTLYYWAQGIVLRPFNAPSSPYQINQNQINIPNLGGTGISVSNAGKGLHLFNNEIHFKTTSAVPENSCAWCRAELVGIDMSNSRDGNLEANKVFGFVDATGQPLANVFNERTAYGLRMYHSRDVGLNCNETHKTRYGFYVVGDCSHADPLTVSGNVFDYHASGILFNHLGSEGTFGQIGDLNHDNNNQFNSSAIAFGSTQLKEIWRVTNSIFTGQIFTMQLTQNQSGSTIGIQGAYEIFLNGVNHTLLNCEDLPVESEIQNLSEIEIQEALQVAGDSINYPEYTELSEWYDERQVYEWLKRDSIARATYPLLNAFYANQESLLTDEIRSLDLNMDILNQENALNDSTIFQNQIQELSQENTALPIGRLFENYEKDLNRIYLSILTQGWQSLTIADYEQLEELALSCPFVKGSAVYKARSLYAHIQPGLFYDDLTICNAVGVYKNIPGINSNENGMDKSFEIFIYPNPAHDYLQIHTSVENENMVVRVYDLTGKLIQSRNLLAQSGLYTLPLTILSPGVYSLQMEYKSQIKYSKFIKY